VSAVEDPTGEVAGETYLLPASIAQQRVWFLDQLEPEGAAAYNVPLSRRLRGPLDTAALERALSALVARHEPLRTTFTVLDGVPHQLIGPARALELEVVDLGAESDPEARALELVEQDATTPFDLATGPLLRARLLRLAAEDHVLSLTLHHNVVDGWSAGVLNRELAELYGAFVEGREPALPELEIQYGDYAAWQREWIAEGGLDRQLEFWKQYLAGAPALLELPTDHPRPSRQSFRGAIVRTQLGPELRDAVRKLGEREGATLFMTLLTAWVVLLSRYSGQEDIVVASPIANRNRTELEGLIGYFANTIALRASLHDDPTFAELLRRVRGSSLDAFSNQDVPFEKLVEELNPERHLGHNPIAQVLFALQRTVESRTTLPGLEQEQLRTGKTTAKFDLSLFASENADGLGLSVEYATDLFDEATAQRVLGHYVTLLEAAIADPERPVAELELLTAAERDELLRERNDTAAEYPRACLHELFATQAAARPDAPAVRSGEQRLTYGELDRRANQLAHELIALGVRRGDLVGICMERGTDLVVAMQGVLKAGAAYVPVDPGHPPQRQAFLLEDAQAPVLLTQSALRAHLPAGEARIVCLDEVAERLAAHPAQAPDIEHDPEQLAYVIYTSGSTGRPKGVEITHRSVVNLVTHMRERPGLSPGEVVVNLTTPAFDLSVPDFHLTLCCGAELVIVAREEAQDGELLARRLRECGASFVQATPTTWQLLLDAGWPGQPGMKVVAGGEALSRALVQALLERGAELWHMYGPTETTVWSSIRPLESGSGPVPLGGPIANTSFYVLDPRGRPVPVGVAGELHIGGHGLARGYRRRPELTAEKFVPDPFSGQPGARMYRTGDLLRWRPDGTLEFLGRIDHQVKIRGYRIELGELESVLREHPAVRETVLVAREDQPGDARLVAYVVAAAPAPSPGELRDHLRRSVPDYMIPSAFVFLDELPLTPNRKIDRKALPAPGGGRELDEEFVAPRTADEEAIAAIWRELLGLDRVGVQDNFFSLGGHSLRATQLMSRIRETLGVTLPLRAIFEAPTVAGLAREAGRVRGAGTAPELPPIVVRHDLRAGEPVVLPASFAQQRLWFLDQLEPYGSAAYNVPLRTRLRGALDTDALARALTELVARHEPLRSTFTTIEGVPHQVIAPPAPMRLEVVDLAGEPEAEERAHELGEQEAARPFELATGPLLRAMVLRIAPDDHLLVMTAHHTVIDGWSMGVLGRELSVLYGAFATGRTPELPELEIQYGDYAAWQQEWIAAGGLDGQLEYWKRQLAGAPAMLELPTDHPRPSRQSFRGAIVRTTLSCELRDGVKALGEREGATLFMTLLAAYLVLLHRYSGQDNIVVASPIANRNRSELEGLIGYFANTIALRATLADDPSFSELVRRVRETSLEAFSNQDVPFEKLVEELNPERHLGHNPIAQVLFALNAVESSLELEGLTRVPMRKGSTTAKFDQFLFAGEVSEGLRVALEYATDLFDEATAQRVLEHYGALLEAAVADPLLPVSRLPLLGAAERAAVLERSEGATADATARCVHELVADQARRTPDAVAVSGAGGELTYAELDRRANQLAHELAALGVGPDSVVAVALERSLDLPLAVLAVLKAGAAYAPVDPSHPEDRIAFMLEDAGAPVLLTQRHLAERLPAGGARVVVVDAAAPLDARSAEPPAAGVTPEHLAYVIYTSGSTGRPKGVAMPHAPLANLIAWQLAAFAAPAAGRTLQFASLSFDVAFQEMFTTWAAGGTLVIVDEALRRDPRALLEHLRTSAVERLFLPFVALHNLCEEAQAADLSVPSLREVITAGEQLKSTPAIRRFFRAHPDCRLRNQYGPTESHVVTAFALPEDPERWGALPPIGRPIAGVSIHVLDRHLEPVPTGVRGELYIGGVALARGYLGRPELTAEKFIADPFRPGGRLYRTGDLARYLPDGNVEFLGRADHQVKVRGYRIEPGEVEALLRSHELVREALVLAREAGGERRLVAYVLCGDPAPEAAELRGFLAQRLPEYMIPSAFVVLDAFPLTPNGKVDRAALPAPDEGAIARSQYAPASSELERALVALWEELLEVEQVGIDDDFFDLGGHSLLAVQLIRRVQDDMRRVCTLPMLFRNRTIRALAAELQLGGGDNTEPTVLRLQPDGQAPALFCIGGVHVYQELADALAPDVPVYGIFLPSEQELFEARRGRRHARALSVEELAALYVRAVRAEQPSGPYLILGLCFGGIVAYEAAQQLRAAGEEVALLVLCDSVRPSALRMDARARLERAARRGRTRARRARNRVQVRLGLREPQSELDRLAEARARVYAQANRRYSVSPYDGPAVLVRPGATLAARRRSLRDQTFGWGAHVPALQIHDVPGDHQTHLKRPNLSILLEVLRPQIDAARRR